MQDEITKAVVTAIHPVVAEAELRRTLRKPPANLSAWESYQRGLWHLAKAKSAANPEVRTFFERAAELDPLFAAPRAMLAFVQVTAMWHAAVQMTKANLESAEAEARRAIELDPDEASALSVLAWVYTCNAQLARAMDAADHAIAANPSYAGAYMAKGRALTFSGSPHRALKFLHTALRLSPRDPLRPYTLGTPLPSQYFAHEYEEVVKTAELTIREYPDYALPHRWLAATLGQLGRAEEALEALRLAIAASPVAFDFFARNRPPWFRPEDHEHMLDGLRKAGWEG